jgi:hypothetical protein
MSRKHGAHKYRNYFLPQGCLYIWLAARTTTVAEYGETLRAAVVAVSFGDEVELNGSGS